MPISTARLSDIDSAILRDVENATSELKAKPRGQGATSLDSNSFLELGARASVYATTARIAGRINAANIPEEEYQELLAERQELLTKKFDETLTRKESNRLDYVRWSLDRIEDARHGQTLDLLEDAIRQYENLGRDIDRLLNQLREHTGRR